MRCSAASDSFKGLTPIRAQRPNPPTAAMESSGKTKMVTACPVIKGFTFNWSCYCRIFLHCYIPAHIAVCMSVVVPGERGLKRSQEPLHVQGISGICWESSRLAQTATQEVLIMNWLEFVTVTPQRTVFLKKSTLYVWRVRGQHWDFIMLCRDTFLATFQHRKSAAEVQTVSTFHVWSDTKLLTRLFYLQRSLIRLAYLKYMRSPWSSNHSVSLYPSKKTNRTAHPGSRRNIQSSFISGARQRNSFSSHTSHVPLGWK